MWDFGGHFYKDRRDYCFARHCPSRVLLHSVLVTSLGNGDKHHHFIMKENRAGTEGHREQECLDTEFKVSDPRTS